MGQKLKVLLSFLPANEVWNVVPSNQNKQGWQQRKPFTTLNQDEQDEEVMRRSSEIKTTNPKEYYRYISELEAIADEVNSIQVLKNDEKKNGTLWNATPVTSDIEGDVRKAFKLLKRCGFIKGDIKVNPENGEIEMELEDNPENVVEGVVCGDIFEAGQRRGHYNYLLFRVLYAIKHSRFGQKLHLIKGNHDLFTGAGSYQAELYSEVDYYKKMIYPYLENRWIKEVEEENPANQGEKKKVFFVFQHAFFTDDNKGLKNKLGEDYEDYKKNGNNNEKKAEWRDENCCNPSSTGEYLLLGSEKHKGYYAEGLDEYGMFGYFPSIDPDPARAKEHYKREEMQNRLKTLVDNLKQEDPVKFQDLTTDNIRLVFGHEHRREDVEILYLGTPFVEKLPGYYEHHKVSDDSKNIFMVDTDDMTNNAGDVYEIPANAFEQHGPNHYYGAMLSVEGGRPEKSEEREKKYHKCLSEKMIIKQPLINAVYRKRQQELSQNMLEDDNKDQQSKQNNQDDQNNNDESSTKEKILEDINEFNQKANVESIAGSDNIKNSNQNLSPPVDANIEMPMISINRDVNNSDNRDIVKNSTLLKKKKTTQKTSNSQTRTKKVKVNNSNVKIPENATRTNNLTSLSSITKHNILPFSTSPNEKTAVVSVGYGDGHDFDNNITNNNEIKTTNNSVNTNGQNNQNQQSDKDGVQNETKSFAIPITTGIIAGIGGVVSVMSFTNVIEGIPIGGKIVLVAVSGALGCFAIGHGYKISQENKQINNQNAIINKKSTNNLKQPKTFE